MKRSVHCATSRPAAPPRTARRHDSVSSCASRCRRDAPAASRTAISDVRAAERASSRFAILAHAIRRTTAVTTSSRNRAGPAISCRPLCPRCPSSIGSVLATNRARVSSLVPTSSGASASVRMLRYSGSIAARAWSRETSGARRAKRYSQYRRRSSKRSAAAPGESLPCIVIGTNTLVGMLNVVPRNPAGATPTMVSGWPLTMRASPSTSRVPPRSDCQNSWLSTTTGCPPMGASTSGPNGRPAAGTRPRVGKYDPETCIPWMLTVCPRYATLAPKPRCATTSVKTVCSRWRSRNIG